MAYYSESEIRTKIKAIDKAIDTVLAGGRFYSIGDGQGNMSVSRENLAGLRAEKEYWLEELDRIQAPGIVSVSVRR